MGGRGRAEGLELIQREDLLKEGPHLLHGVELTPSRRCHGFIRGADSGGGRLTSWRFLWAF